MHISDNVQNGAEWALGETSRLRRLCGLAEYSEEERTAYKERYVSDLDKKIEQAIITKNGMIMVAGTLPMSSDEEWNFRKHLLNPESQKILFFGEEDAVSGLLCSGLERSGWRFPMQWRSRVQQPLFPAAKCFSKHQPLMPAVGSFLPEFEFAGDDAPAAPMRGAGDFLILKPCFGGV